MPVDYPRRYWWLVLVVVPVAVALINGLSSSRCKPPPNGASGGRPGEGVFLLSLHLERVPVILLQRRERGGGLAPDEVKHRLDEGMKLAGRGQYAEALAALEEVADEFPVAGFDNNVAVLRALTGDLPAAQEAFEQALAGQADYAEAHFNAGLLAEKRADFVKAADHWQKAKGIREAEQALAKLPDRTLWTLVGAKEDLPRGGDTFESAPELRPGRYRVVRELEAGKFEYFRAALKPGQLLVVKFRTPDRYSSAGAALYNTDGQQVAGDYQLGASALGQVEHLATGAEPLYIGVGVSDSPGWVSADSVYLVHIR